MDKKSKIISIAAFSVILLAGFLINGILSHSSFEGVYTDTLMNRYTISGESAKNGIENSLNMGKKLYLMNEQTTALIGNIMRDYKEIEHIYISDATGKIINSTRTVLNNDRIPFSYYEGSVPVPDEHNVSYSCKFLDSWFLCIPFFESEVNYAGTLYIEVSRNTVSELAFGYVQQLVISALVIFVISFIIYLIFLQVLPSSKGELILTICLVFFSQGGFSLYTSSMYKSAITELFNQNLSILSTSIKDSLESPARISKGYDNLIGVGDYLKKRLDCNPDCSGIYITDSDMNVLYTAHEEGSPQVIDRIQQGYIITLIENADNNECNLVLKINNQKISEIIRDMILDDLVIVIVAIIFAFILKDAFVLLANKKDLLLEPSTMTEEETATALRLIKISTFIFMFAAYITLSFVPMYIEFIYRISKDYLPAFLSGFSITLVS